MGINKYLLRIFFLLVNCLAAAIAARAQPANDNCANAKAIAITNGGYGMGTFTSSTDDITSATIQAGEYFPIPLALANLNKKSMWYKFSIPTTRKVSVSLLQPGSAFGTNDAGFTVYKTSTCLPGQTAISNQLTALPRFGTTAHPCVPPGDYFIQVSTTANANGLLFIQLQVSDSTGALYDHPSSAYDFGVLPPYGKYVDYAVSCQSVEDATEICSLLPGAGTYNKTTWHTFTTPAYFDYISFLFSGTGSPTFDNVYTSRTFGYSLYKGNVRTGGINSLTGVNGCDTLKTDGAYAAYKIYKCDQLQPNTTYTVQLFFHESFSRDVRVGFYTGGTAPAGAPEPIAGRISASNQLGVISTTSGTNTINKTDYLACNSRHSIHPCMPSLPSNGILHNNKRYSLSTFFTFTLTATSQIAFNPSGCGDLLLQLYKQDLTASCTDLDTINRLEKFTSFRLVDCLQPGNYVLQVSGVDTVANFTYFTSSTATSTTLECLVNSLGTPFNLNILVYPRKGSNLFSLSTPGAFNAINSVGSVMQPLVNGITYPSQADTFGCKNTVLPDTVCGAVTKVMYREFKVADSGYIKFTGISGSFHTLFAGDANALAISQNAFAYPKKLSGLIPKSPCFKNDFCSGHRFCVTPGTYTLATFGDEGQIGNDDNPALIYNEKKSLHYSAETAQDMGNIIDLVPNGSGSLESDVDYFSCKDNAVSIAGVSPCLNFSIPTTKAVYRQFYLKQSAIVSIKQIDTCQNATSFFTLFKGKATDGAASLSAMPAEWRCLSYKGYTVPLCDPLPAGWYTVVSYSAGPNYTNHLQGLSYNAPGLANQVVISVTPACAAPRFNRPYKAAVDSLTGQPFLIEWKDRPASTPAYPRSDTSYTLRKENFNCSADTPFTPHPIVPCKPNMRRVAYYIFKTTQQSYIQINNLGDYWAVVYPFDVRADSLQMAANAPIQPCVKGTRGSIQLCDVQPGSYTLVVFAGDTTICTSVQPIIYVDRAGTSRFDHAMNAYDFGTVPADSAWHNGKMGDVNPLNPQRAASNDFFYCNTGAQIKNPIDAICGTELKTSIYNNPQNNAIYTGDLIDNYNVPRRNLWYTFVADKPGWIHVKLDTKTPGKMQQHNFAVYGTDEDGSLPFTNLVSTGKVDSTLAQGLSFIAYNGPYTNLCYGKNEIVFYRDPCTNKKPGRYYVLVDFAGGYNIADYPPNNQVELSLLVDSVPAYSTRHDKYFEAYDFGTIGAGSFTGGTDNYSCATKDNTEPVYAFNNCTKTLWYKFTTTVTGNIRYRIVANGNRLTSIDQLQIFRQTKSMDSTSAGLSILNTSPDLVTDATTGTWARACIFPGTYYMILPGCNKTNETVFPELQIIEAAGDFCSRPVIGSLVGPGSVNATAIIDCHTIGGDYGEYNPTITCPNGGITDNYKSSWFRLDITGNDTLDITTFITESTGANASDIKYRMMTGNCGAMQEQSCVLDALTQNTYKCLTPGSYFFQAFTPVYVNNNPLYPVTGDLTLHITAVKHVDSCGAINNCLANANFTYVFNCSTDTVVQFLNYSTFGDSMSYEWTFGFNGQTSTEISPTFNYPILQANATYPVKLRATNLGCNGRDSLTVNVVVPGRPRPNLSPDTIRCTAGNITLNAATWPGTAYLWNTGATSASIAVNTPGSNKFYVRLTYNGCVSSDTIVVNINPITGQNQTSVFCPNLDSLLLVNFRNYGELHYWNTGATTPYLYVTALGSYSDSISWKGCPAKDIYTVVGPTYNPLGNDTTLCLKQPLLLNATSIGAIVYQWQNGSINKTFTVNSPGKYWVNVIYPGCNFRDTITVNNVQAQLKNSDTSICNGQTLMLPWGNLVNSAGIYYDTLQSAKGCDSIINSVNLVVKAVSRINSGASVCEGQNFVLPSGKMANAAGTYNDTLQYKSGCDSVVNTITLGIKPLSRSNLSAAICPGENYILPSGKTINTIGLFNDTILYKTGCDSLITTVTLTQKPVSTIAVSGSVCEGQIYTLPSGKTINTTGVYNDTLYYKSGCDSVIATVNLSVKPLFRTSVSAAVCPGAVYTFISGKIANTSGTHYDTLHYVSGCDSLITKLDLTIKAATIVNSAPSICEGENYTLPSGAVVTTGGIYTNAIKDMVGCDSIVNKINLAVRPVPAINITKSNDINCIFGTATLGASEGNKYTWSPPTGLSNVNIYNPIATPQATTVYKVLVTSAAGCQAIDSIELKVNKGNADGGFLLPSSFTPNGDGKNDCFGVKSWGYVTDLHFTIYNRWGNLVFTSTNSSVCWDGTYKGRKQGSGAFVYQVTATTNCGPIQRRGTIVLIR